MSASSTDAPSPRVHAFATVLVPLIVLSAVYSPVLRTRYGCLDDYVQLDAFTRARFGESTEAHHQWALGRPICGLLMEAVFRSARTISGLWVARAAAAACLSVLAAFLARVLLRTGWSLLESLALALLATTLPAFQVYVSWASTAPHIVACLSAAVAASFTERSGQVGAARGIGWLGLAVLFQIIAVIIYQAAAMFYVAVAAIFLYSPRADDFHLRKLTRFGAVLGAGLGVGFLVFRLGMRMHPEQVAAGRSGISLAVLGKLSWFVRAPLRDALNLHNVRVSDAAAVLVATVIVAGLLVRSRRTVTRLGGLLLAAALVVLSYVPNLLVAERWPAYRTQAALASLTLVLLFVAVRALASLEKSGWLWRTLLPVAVIAGTVTAFQNTRTLFAVPQWRELAALRQRVASLPMGREVDVRASSWSDSIAPAMRYDEFGIPSTCLRWNAVPLLRLIAKEQRTDDRAESVRLLGDGESPRRDAVLLDMQEVLRDAARRTRAGD